MQVLLELNIRKVLHFCIGPIGAAAIGFIIVPLLAWFFSAEDIGRFNLLQVLTSFVLLSFGLGLDQAYVREYHTTTDRNALLKAALVPPSIVFLIFICFSFFFSISQLMFGIDSGYLNFLVSLIFLFSLISMFFTNVLVMKERGLAYSVSQIVLKVVFIIAMVSSIFLKFETDVFSLLTIHLISVSIVFIVLFTNLRNDLFCMFKSSLPIEHTKKMLRFGLPLIGAGLAFWGVTAIDRVFLRVMSTFEELGVYSVAVSFAGAALVFKGIFSAIWVPTLYRWEASGLKPEKVGKIINIVLFVTLILWSLAGMFSWLTDYLLPEKYLDVKFLLIATMAYPLLYTLSEVTGVGIGIKRKTLLSLLAAVMSLVTNLICNYLLVPSFGAAGAAVSSAVSFLVFFMLKTSFSNAVWIRFPTFKLYSTTILMVLLSSIPLLYKVSSYYVVFMWATVFFVSLYLNKDIVVFLFKYLTQAYQKHKQCN